jgi:hypothetical protein
MPNEEIQWRQLLQKEKDKERKQIFKAISIQRARYPRSRPQW